MPNLESLSLKTAWYLVKYKSLQLLKKFKNLHKEKYQPIKKTQSLG